MLAIKSVPFNKGKRFRVKRTVPMLRFRNKGLKLVILFFVFVCVVLYLRCNVPKVEDTPRVDLHDSQPIVHKAQVITVSKRKDTSGVLKTTSSTVKEIRDRYIKDAPNVALYNSLVINATKREDTSRTLKTTSSTPKGVSDKYIKVGYFDLKGNDLVCDREGKCQDLQVRNAEQGMMLCQSYDKDCQGFVFAPKTGRLFLKTLVTGEPVHDPFFEFYVREEFLASVNLFLKKEQCAVPLEDFNDSSRLKCSLPVLDPFDANMMKYMDKTITVVKCPGKKYTAYNDGVLSLLRKDLKIAQVKVIKRKPHSDWGHDLIPKQLSPSGKGSAKVNEEFLQIEAVAPSGEKIVEYHAKAVPKVEVLRRKRSEKGLNVNVLLVGFDSTSSAQMQRALPKVYKFLKDDLHSHIFKGYSVVGDGTTPQLTAMLTGHTEMELPEARRGYPESTNVDSWPWIFKEFRNHGYATLYSEDDAYYNAFNYRLHGFRDAPADHYTRPFWLAARTEGYCIKSTPQPQMHFDYIESFFKAYKNVSKIALAFLASISHSNMNTLKPAEKFVLKFFKSIWEKGYLSDTILITFSDHGMRFGEARGTMQSRLEERLPFLSITLPKSLRKKFPKLNDILKANTDRLLSPFDIHTTLRHVLNYPNGELNPGRIGLSLFQSIPENRHCAACGIPEHYCPCVQLRGVPTTHTHVQKALEGLIAHINKMLMDDNLTSKMCAKIEHGVLRSAYQNLNHPKLVTFVGSKDIDGRIPRFRNHTSDYECNYQLTFGTYPGGGLFEATVQLLDGKFHYGNEISRINKYGSQPNCIAQKRPYLRKFCFCKALGGLRNNHV